MAEEFQAAGICGGAWWNSPKSVIFPGSCLSACPEGNIGGGDTSNGFGWQINVDNTSDMKSRLSCNNQSAVSSSSMAFAQKLQRDADSDSGGSSVTMDSTLQMMGLGFSTSANSSSSDWKQAILQEDLNPSLMNYSSYGARYSSSSLLTNFYDSSDRNPSILNNVGHSINNFMPSSLPSCSNNIRDGDPQLSLLSWDKSENLLKSSSSLLLSSPREQTCGFNFSNTNSTFWSSSIAANTNNSIRTNSFVPASPQISSRVDHNITPKTSSRSEVRDSRLVGKKPSDEPAAKKSRITTPSPLPTFKVRKENLRDQITALQQLVSPFGKTDTASVLQEAIEYIKFLHDQVLSTPYMKQGTSVHQQQQKVSEKSKDSEGNGNQELKSRGLCLVPISITFPVANETTADFWTPTFGGNNLR